MLVNVASVLLGFCGFIMLVGLISAVWFLCGPTTRHEFED